MSAINPSKRKRPENAPNYFAAINEKIRNGYKPTEQERSVMMSNILLGRLEVRRKNYMELGDWFSNADAVLRSYFNTSVDALAQKGRHREFADLRKIVMHTAYYAGYPVNQVGKVFGRHHATAIHARARYEEYIETDKRFRQMARIFVENLIMLDVPLAAYSLSLLGLDKEYELEPLTEIHPKRTARVI
jgi:hypothetical protein